MAVEPVPISYANKIKTKALNVTKLSEKMDLILNSPGEARAGRIK